MADKKISEFPVASTVLATDVLPIVSAGANKGITAGVFALNLPNFGNKGITKNTPVAPSTAAIPLTATVVKLPIGATYTLAAGQDGQELLIVALSVGSTVTTTGSTFASASFTNGGLLQLIFITGIGWKSIVTSGVTLA